MSTALVHCLLPTKTSGAIQANVPIRGTSERYVPFWSRLRPTSASLAVPPCATEVRRCKISLKLGLSDYWQAQQARPAGVRWQGADGAARATRNQPPKTHASTTPPK